MTRRAEGYWGRAKAGAAEAELAKATEARVAEGAAALVKAMEGEVEGAAELVKAGEAAAALAKAMEGEAELAGATRRTLY